MIDYDRGKTHLTAMNAKTTLSAKGQVVIPKDVRDSLGLKPGTELSVRQMGRRIVLEVPDSTRERIDLTEFRRRVPRYSGPPLAIEDMSIDFDTLWPNRP